MKSLMSQMSLRDWIELGGFAITLIGWLLARLNLPASWMKMLSKIGEANVEAWIDKANAFVELSDLQKRAWVAEQIKLYAAKQGWKVPDFVAHAIVSYMWDKCFAVKTQ